MEFKVVLNHTFCHKLFFFFKRVLTYGVPIKFWCRRGLNPISLIQLSETLLIELIGTHVTNVFERQLVINLYMNGSLKALQLLINKI